MVPFKLPNLSIDYTWKRFERSFDGTVDIIVHAVNDINYDEVYCAFNRACQEQILIEQLFVGIRFDDRNFDPCVFRFDRKVNIVVGDVTGY